MLSSLGVSAVVKKITVVVTWLQGCIKTDCVHFIGELFCSKLGLNLSLLLTMPGLYSAVCSHCSSSLTAVTALPMFGWHECPFLLHMSSTAGWHPGGGQVAPPVASSHLKRPWFVDGPKSFTLQGGCRFMPDVVSSSVKSHSNFHNSSLVPLKAQMRVNPGKTLYLLLSKSKYSILKGHSIWSEVGWCWSYNCRLGLSQRLQPLAETGFHMYNVAWQTNSHLGVRALPKLSARSSSYYANTAIRRTSPSVPKCIGCLFSFVVRRHETANLALFL